MISMKTRLAALSLALAGTTGPLWAQGYPINPALRPAVSPYINLTRQGSSAGVNYYGLVRPEVQFRGALLHTQQEIANNQQSISNLAAAGVPPTGHPAGFMTQWKYFMNTGSAAPVSAFRRTLNSQRAPSSPNPNISAGLR